MHAFSACFCLKEGLKGAFLARARQGKGSVSRPQGVGMIVSRQRYEKKRPLRVKICKNKNPVLIFLLIFAPRFSCYRKAPSRCLAWRSWETRIAFVGNAQGVRGKRTTGASGTTSPERLQLKARSEKSGTQPPGADGCNFRT